MRLDWIHFTPFESLAGGLLIGLAAAVFILVHGRIMGVSGILGGLMPPLKGDILWRVSFMLGLIAAPLIARLAGLLPEVQIEGSLVQLILAGLLVGFGTALGSGCTSGHGVCGMARLSPRSIVATILFVGSGMVTVWAVRAFGLGV
jgi:uncharacterized membrane protein YedE/YeeE